MHIGNAKQEHYALARVLIEPLPWPGNPKKTRATTNRGVNLFEVRDKASGALLYSRGFSTVFAEWQRTAEAAKLDRGFQESLRFPKPNKPVNLRILGHDAKNQFEPVWSGDVDTDASDVIRKQPPSELKPPIDVSGAAAEKVDLLIRGDELGHTRPHFRSKPPIHT